jgi:hypothetical protein
MRQKSPRLRARPELQALEPRWQPAAPAVPTYSTTFTDAVTADNAVAGTGGRTFWTIDAGADQYQTDTYERPTAQTFQVRRAADGSRVFAAEEYYANLDIAQGRAGADDQFLYVAIKMAGVTHATADGQAKAEGLIYQYGFRIGTNADGNGSFLITADQPAEKNGNGAFGGEGVYAYWDANQDVGGTGRDVTKEDREAEVGGNGYEGVVAADGRGANGQRIVWTRVSPTDPTVVEFAVDYSKLGLTKADLAAASYFELEANKGLKDKSNYAWNDEYTKSEAGSPYQAATGTLSEFGTQGLGNVYELDTLRGGPIVPPAPQRGSLSGTVFLDLNQDGVRDATDPGIAGVPIHLLFTDADGVARDIVTVTRDDGTYEFTDLAPGVYTLFEEQVGEYIDGADVLGSLGGIAENDLFREIVVGPGQFGVNYDFGELVNDGGSNT